MEFILSITVFIHIWFIACNKLSTSKYIRTREGMTGLIYKRKQIQNRKSHNLDLATNATTTCKTNIRFLQPLFLINPRLWTNWWTVNGLFLNVIYTYKKEKMIRITSNAVPTSHIPNIKFVRSTDRRNSWNAREKHSWLASGREGPSLLLLSRFSIHAPSNSQRWNVATLRPLFFTIC